jgi:hypothetical protein
MKSSGAERSPTGLVLVAHGPAELVRGLLEQAAPELAAALALPWAGFLDVAEPHAALAELPAGLVALPQDPGRSLAAGGHWAEALGAWRQPAVVVLSVDQVESGWAAASAALLTQQAVPLLGLVQWGGPWDAPLRRREQLPWLGWLTPEQAGFDGDAAGLRLALRQALGLRWHALAADQVAARAPVA